MKTRIRSSANGPTHFDVEEYELYHFNHMPHFSEDNTDNYTDYCMILLR